MHHNKVDSKTQKHALTVVNVVSRYQDAESLANAAVVFQHCTSFIQLIWHYSITVSHVQYLFHTNALINDIINDIIKGLMEAL